MFAHFTSKLNLCTCDGVMFAHLWLMYFFLQICTFEGTDVVVCTFEGGCLHKWLFSHLCVFAIELHTVSLWFCTFHGSTVEGPIIDRLRLMCRYEV